ncbi:cystathionine beta-lyase [Variovorax sp. VNK109]|jgi:cystathionine beta-lyase|uniref:cystathionine beta-lyase n=1 Tax=Variovorax sp. VNK109 TaxID=3400919 RepID=UPI003C0EDD3E
MLEKSGESMHADTLAVHAGRNPTAHGGTVNVPVWRASTICFPDMASLQHARQNPDTEISYGIYGTPTVRALQDAVAQMEGGHRALVASSGLAAISAAILAFASPGDHILMVDSVYGPTRRLCDQGLSRLGISVTYYDPLESEPGGLIRPETKLIYAESPGSQTFEVQDIPALAAVARSAGIPLLLDNSWGTPYHFASFRHGVDISIHAATKYIAGHSDVMLGLVVANERWYPQLREHMVLHGMCASPDDCYLALRGLRTIGARLKQQSAAALHIAQWLQQQPQVASVLHPALPGFAGHALWKRDFTGAASLFAVELRTQSEAAVRAMVEGMSLFAIGASWGGFESLVFPAYPGPERALRPWTGGQLVRLHIGLEEPGDLVADLAAGLVRAQAHPDWATV